MSENCFSVNVYKFNHETRSAITAIIGLVNLIRKWPLNQEQHRYLEYITRVSQDFLSYSNNLLIEASKNKTSNSFLQVLLVEDHPVIQLLHKRMLEDLGCSVTSVSSGEEAILSLDDAYDLVLLDLGLPGMHGTEVAKNIRNSIKNKKTRVVALTAHVDDGVERDCFTAGINQVVSKPIDLIGLRSIVKEASKKGV